MRRAIVRVALGLSLALVAGIASAQSLATLQGFISDDTGGLLPGATVVVRNVDTGLERTVVTDARGFYIAPRIPSGNYSVTVSLTGFQTVLREGIVLLVGQTLDVNVTLSVAAVEEVLTVTAESPLVETSSSANAKYITETEIMNLPLAGRDYVNLALLTPTVKLEPNRGGVSLSGQRGVNSGLAIDGTEAKSAFFGYARGGEATENEGLVVAQDSVKEFQVIVDGFAPEYGRNGGGYINVITKSGTNNVRGTGFFLFRNEGLSSNQLRSPLEEYRGIPKDDPRFAPSEYKRLNWGASLGGPIVQDKTHFFFSYDQTSRTDPFRQNINGRGLYDALLETYPGLVDGFQPNSDGVAAADPVNGRTAVGNFSRDVDNVILFGKIDHQVNETNTLSVRYNYTDFKRASDWKAEESLKKERTHSLVGSMVTLIGTNGVNEFRFQYAQDNLDRLANLDSTDPVANIRITSSAGQESFGKPYYLPIKVREKKYQFQDNFTYLFGNHDLKFGVDANIDKLSEYFAGAASGRYDYDTIDLYLANQAKQALIFFGDVSDPNVIVPQSLLGMFVQDDWKPNEKLTLSYGLRWEATFNPGGIRHLDPAGQKIPNDTNNFGPRVGVAYRLTEDARDVLRAGAGLFYGRTPTLLFADPVQSNGFDPGLLTVRPGQTGFVPLGETIDNENPPAGTIPALGLFAPGFQDPETWRFNLGYERELAPNWSGALDFTYAHGQKLQSTYDANTFDAVPDQYGRPVYPSGRPDPNFNVIRTRDSISWSNYYAITASIQKRFSAGFQMQAHYTWSRDKDNDSTEREASNITVTDPNNLQYDYGFSTRDITHRVVFSAVWDGPGGLIVTGGGTVSSGTAYSALDPNRFVLNHPTGNPLGRRAIIDGAVSGRGEFRNPAYKNVDMRIGYSFDFGQSSVEVFGEIFNLLNNANFAVTDGSPDTVQSGQQEYYLRDGTTLNPEFGLGDSEIGLNAQRQLQIGVRLNY